MQNSTSPLAVIRYALMALGVLLFLVYGSWSLGHLEDKSAVRGTAETSPQISISTILPR